MKKEVKIGNKDAPKKIAEILRKNREQPIPKEVYEIVEGYKREQLKKKEKKIAAALIEKQKETDI